MSSCAEGRGPAPRPVRSHLSCQKNQARRNRVPSLPQAWAPHPLPASSLLLTVWLQVLFEIDSSGPRFPAISQCATMCSVGRRQSHPQLGVGAVATAVARSCLSVCRCLRAVLFQEGLAREGWGAREIALLRHNFSPPTTSAFGLNSCGLKP